jgi:hypothetical protein
MKAWRKGGKEGWRLNNPLADAIYAWSAYAQGAKVGAREARTIVQNGDARNASKYVEESKQGKPSTGELERDVYGEGKRFKPISITIAGKKFDLNPWNWAKFSGRTLLAEDATMMNTSFGLDFALAVREKLIKEKGLSGRALRDAVLREIREPMSMPIR